LHCNANRIVPPVTLIPFIHRINLIRKIYVFALHFDIISGLKLRGFYGMTARIIKKTRVLCAMSGGVDSSVAAAMLVEQGFDVVGITMRVASGEGRESSDRACCTLDASNDARRVADKLGVPHYVVNYLQRFEKEVIDDFLSEYLAGRTPNPCARCNQRVKFGALYEKAMAIEADYIATGHYVRLVDLNGRKALKRAAYRPKDQSYTLAGLQQEQLQRAMFPLGDMTKDETRSMARSLGLVTANKAESQEICFVPNDDYRAFVEKRMGAGAPGPIKSTGGDVLGEHSGLVNYTIGQRKGLGIAAPRPLYVLRLDMQTNTLVVGHEEETLRQTFFAKDIIWGGLAAQPEPFDCCVQIRYRHNAVPATCHPEGDRLRIVTHDPERAPTPGQWAVLYDADDCVLAAAIIE
jgi:tRNA-specific 2-thiouridylase